MKDNTREARKKRTALVLVLMVAASLAAGCASESTSYEKDVSKSVDGQTVVVEKEESKTTRHHNDTGILGGAFHLIGEVLAFPFEVVAGLFRLIF